MSKQAFITKRFNRSSVLLITQCDEIIENYQDQGYRLTLRQLYYQLVSRNIIENKERSYKNLSALVSDARLAGLLDWDAIEDRGRQARRASEFEGLQDLANAAVQSYRLPRWRDQDNYVELWVEKDALAGVLWPLASEYHVTLMVNKGYSSQSAMYESAERFRERAHQEDKDAYLFYLGDHDPSGEDMVRDIRERLIAFNTDIRVDKIALTKKQIRKYKPPPNPTKVTDPRAAKYIEEHGEECWEVDALPPEVLSEVIRTALEGVVDMKKMKRIKEQEERDKHLLLQAVANL